MKKLIELYLNIYHFWMRLPEKLRYLLVGGYNTVVSYGLYALILWGWSKPQMALFLSFIISSVNSYWTQKIYVFGTKGNCKKEYARNAFIKSMEKCESDGRKDDMKNVAGGSA